ncbi:MAG TPA: trypsin-like peptidase domain-containing protein [Cryptosporangiaceae bacterium]|nr:trypsin-like peptidase domain-containing protein [Cryptosporangiaceae bacterium]
MTSALRAAIFAVLTVSLLAGCTGEVPEADRSSDAAATTGKALPLPEVVRRVEPSVVTVFVGQGSGSGVVYRNGGVVVTNAHVVGEARQAELGLADGSRTSATVVAVDRVTDLAVLQAERKDLPPARFETGLPQVGQTVVVIGTPLGFANSVTAGIVSGVGREIPGSAETTRALVDLIQTDAAISPGNSGGALVNTAGQVVGINEAYIPPQAGAVSLGFAIPAATVVDVVDDLLATGRARHPLLGIAPAPLTPQLAEAFGIGVDAGVLVRQVTAGGPAAQAGVQPGDVITELAGEQVRSVEELLGALRKTEPGDEVKVGFYRGKDRRTLTVTLGEQR